MKLSQAPALKALLTTYFSDSDADADSETMASTAAQLGEGCAPAAAQLKAMLADDELPLEELGMESNRWFASQDEAREWLSRLASALRSSDAGTGGALQVKDSNGTLLAEGDSVTVIKDLKVKGGSSDLKRGTLIKKIHLVDDAEAVECRVDGSTLVLKTCFLKKA